MLPIYSFSRALDYSTLESLPSFSFKKDWYGRPLQNAPSFVLASDPTNLWFYASWAAEPAYDAALECGQFMADLWKRDTAEFFLCEDGSARYQEFNLSPAGAWWTCVLKDYRKPEEPGKHSLPRVNCLSHVKGGKWMSAIAVERETIAVRASLTEVSRANVSFIADSPHYRFITWAGLSAAQPDFHKADQFENLGPIQSPQNVPTPPPARI